MLFQPQLANEVIQNVQLPSCRPTYVMYTPSIRSPSVSSGTFRDRVRDLDKIKTIHRRNSVVFGPDTGSNPYVSCAMADYTHPVETARKKIMQQRRDNF